jgi:hypothetical protein
MAKRIIPSISNDDVSNFKSVENTAVNISSTLNDIIGSAREFAKAMKDADSSSKSLASKIVSSISGYDKLAQETTKFVEKIKLGTASQAEFNRLQLKLKDNIAGTRKSYNDSLTVLKNLTGSTEDLTTAAGKLNVLQEANVTLLSEQGKVTKLLKDLSEETDNIKRKSIATDIIASREIEKQLRTTIGIAGNLLEIQEESKNLNKVYQKIGLSFDKVMARSKDIKKILETVSKIPILKNFIDLEKLGKELSTAKKDANLFKEAFKGVTGQIGAMLKTPLGRFSFYAKILEITVGIYKKLAKVILEQDKAITELGKNIGISKDEAVGLYDNFAKYARESNKAYLTSIELVNANNDLNELLGSSAAFSTETLDNYVTFTKVVGLSKEAFVGLNFLSFKNSQSFESTEKSVIRTVNRQIIQGKVTANYRKVIEQVGKVSANIAMSFGNMTGKIAEGIVLAKQMGTTLEQTARIGETLLDFQSSIESELQAELLTGKQINLERARAAYLYNDQITFLKEINKEIGTYSDFMDMNQIQRSIFAKSFGMQKEEFAEMLKMAELEKQYSGISAKTAREQLDIVTKSGGKIDEVILKNLKERALQEQILDLTTKIKQTFVDIAAGPIGTLAKGLIYVLEKINSISKAVGDMFGGGELGKKAAAVLMAIPLIVPGFLALKGLIGFFTRGSFANPMVTVDLASAGGGGGFFGGGGGKAGGTVINPRTGRSIKVGGPTYNKLKGQGVKFPKGGMRPGVAGLGGLGAILGGMALEYGADKAAGSGNTGLATGLGAGSGALTGASIGLTLATLLGAAGVGLSATGVGALVGIPALLGAAYMANKYANPASGEMPMEDFVIKPLKKDTIVAAGGTNLGRTDEMVSLLQQLVGTVKAGNKIDINSKTLVTYQNMGGVVSTAIA